MKLKQLFHLHSWLHHPQFEGAEYYCWTCGATKAETDLAKRAANLEAWEQARNDFYVANGIPRWWLGEGSDAVV